MKNLSLLLVAVSVAACGDAEAPRSVSNDPFCQQVIPAVDAWVAQARDANPTPSDERYGGTVVSAATADLGGGMNASSPADANAVQHQQFVNMMTLIAYDENAEPVPYLAESFEIADDGSSVTFRLRQDVYWHDGELTDAGDVAFTFRALMDPATAFPNAAFWDNYDKGEGGIEVLDDFTVRFAMRPHAMPLDPFRAVAVLPEHLLGDVPLEELKQHPFGTQCPVGNGPFVFYSHDVQDRWVFEANPGFPAELGGRPYIDRYVYRVIPEQTTLLSELLTGGVDVYLQPPPAQLPSIVDADDLELLTFVGRSYSIFGWNARLPKLADRRVRTALGMAINRQEIVDAALGGYGVVANTGVPPFHFAYDEELESPAAYDQEGARALLSEAGWVDRDGDGVRENAAGEPLEITLKYHDNFLVVDMATISQAHLAEVGVALNLEQMDFGALTDQLQEASRPFEAIAIAWRAEFRLDDMDLFHSDRSDQPFAFTGTNNPEIDRLLEALSVSVDEEESRALWVDYQRAIMEEQPYTFFYFRDQLGAVNRRVRGVEMDARGELLNLRDWYVDPVTR